MFCSHGLCHALKLAASHAAGVSRACRCLRGSIVPSTLASSLRAAWKTLCYLTVCTASCNALTYAGSPTCNRLPLCRTAPVVAPRLKVAAYLLGYAGVARTVDPNETCWALLRSGRPRAGGAGGDADADRGVRGALRAAQAGQPLRRPRAPQAGMRPCTASKARQSDCHPQTFQVT